MEIDCPFIKDGKAKIRFCVLATEGDIPAQAKLHGIVTCICLDLDNYRIQRTIISLPNENVHDT